MQTSGERPMKPTSWGSREQKPNEQASELATKRRMRHVRNVSEHKMPFMIKSFSFCKRRLVFLSFAARKCNVKIERESRSKSTVKIKVIKRPARSRQSCLVKRTTFSAWRQSRSNQPALAMQGLIDAACTGQSRQIEVPLGPTRAHQVSSGRWSL